MSSHSFQETPSEHLLDAGNRAELGFFKQGIYVTKLSFSTATCQCIQSSRGINTRDMTKKEMLSL